MAVIIRWHSLYRKERRIILNGNIVNDEHQKSLTYRRSWIPMNKTGQMRFFVFTGMNPVSFQFNFRWIWKNKSI